MDKKIRLAILDGRCYNKTIKRKGLLYKVRPVGLDPILNVVERRKRDMPELKYEIVKECGVLSQTPSGWTKELNLISWNDRAPKYDIREWAPGRAKMGKGCTISVDEMILLRDLIGNLDL